MPHRLVLLSLLACSLTAADLSLGHPDFIPSPERPIGWRGDGTGCYPGADPVAHWDLQSGKNVVWQQEMPVYAASGPIVVGDRVFTTAEPDLLICVEAETGKELWRQHGAVFMESLAKAERDHLYAAVAEIYDATDKWCRYPAAYQGKYDVQYGNAADVLWLPSGGGRKSAEDQEAFRKQILELAAERKIDVARIRALYQEVGLIRNKDLRTTPLKTPDGRCLMSDLWCGSTAATPASDGKIVIQKVQNFRFGGNRWGYLNAYDMDGKRLWSVDIGYSGSWDYTYDSPLLVAGMAIAQGSNPDPKNDGNLLYGIDASSGKVAWTAPIRGGTCSPVSFEVDGESLVCFDSQIFRPRDGKQVCDFRDYSVMNFDTPCFDGALMFERGGEGTQYRANAGVRNVRACMSHVLKFSWTRKPDQLTYEQVWRAEEGEKWDLVGNWVRGSSIFRDGWVFFADKGVSMFAYNTAVPYARGMQINWAPPAKDVVDYGDAKFGEPKENDMSAVMGGKLLFGCQTNWPVSQFTVITHPPKIEVVGAPLAGGPVMGSPCFQGERMYVRDYRYLTCIAKSKNYHSPKGGTK